MMTIEQDRPFRFYELPLTAIRSQGFLREFLVRQRDGLTGNYLEAKYPFNTCMWTGKIAPYYRECDYNGLEETIPDSELWWPYEQSAYLLDGALRVGLLLNDGKLVELFRSNLDWLLKHVLPDGKLGGMTYHHHSEWPMAVFYKAVSAYLKCYPDEHIIEAFHKHYAALSDEQLAREFREITNLEGILDIARLTGDDALKARAFRLYDRFNETPKPDPFFALTLHDMELLENPVYHGVTLCEEIKLPVLLYLAGGDDRYLRAAEHCWRNLMKYHAQIPGVPCAVEYGFGRDPNQGYETCVISDSLYSLGFFLMAEGKGEYADTMEKIAYNALPGAITKDFCTLQYLSAPNQVLATPFSNSSSYLRGITPFRQYRPDHFPACCPGNVHRAMPNFIARMWLSDESGAPAAAMFGPSEASGSYAGEKWEISETTEYPFGEIIRFEFKSVPAERMPFYFRIPGWCKTPRAFLNGKNISDELSSSGAFTAVTALWQPGDELTLELPMEVRHCVDRQWSWFEAGPIVYSLPVEHSAGRENPASRFSPVIMEPESDWAYAVMPENKAVFSENSAPAKYPLDGAPRFLQVRANRERGAFAATELHRYTPRVPLECNLGEETTLTLVPMGMTETRITAFPDGKKRRFYPPLSAFAKKAGEMDALGISPEEFRKNSLPIFANSAEYFDLAKLFGTGKAQEAWLQIRFWSDETASATVAVMASEGGVGWFNGEKVLAIPPLMDAESMEPLWFPVTLSKGFNYLLLKIEDTAHSSQHPDAWGATAMLFSDEEGE